MRAKINLSSEPFRGDRLFLVASAAIAALLLVTFLTLISFTIADRGRMHASLSETARLDNELARMRRQQHELDAELRLPRNADVLERSQFINALLYRKGISWTRLFGDLETVLPPDVSIISIRPQADSKDHIFLDLVVGCKSQAPVINLLSKFESSDLFGHTAVYGILPPSQTDPLFRYRVSVNYAQIL